jgi:hypothetical protein
LWECGGRGGGTCVPISEGEVGAGCPVLLLWVAAWHNDWFVPLLFLIFITAKREIFKVFFKILEECFEPCGAVLYGTSAD